MRQSHAGTTLGDHLRQYRTDAGLTQEELAERAGLSVRALSDIERGTSRAPYRATLHRLASALDLDAGRRAILDRAREGPEGHLQTSRYGSLPIPLSGFVGRDLELEHLRTRLQTARLLTLVGVGGVGKSRLALHLAAMVESHYPDGAAFVELASVQDADMLPHLLMRGLGVPEPPGRAVIDVLIETLRSRQVLVILDNCEHLIEACAQLVSRLLQVCPGVRVLATSREPLAISGEVIWRVAGLAVPVPDCLSVEELHPAEAVSLFVQRGAAVQPGFELTPDNASAVIEVCRRLEGIPLAIELAAAWLPVLSPEQIAERLDNAPELLTRHGREGDGRHVSLLATLDWSYRLLEANEQLLFDRLAVFAGGWNVDAPASVCAGTGLNTRDFLPSLALLVDASLVVAEPRAATMRYRFLEPVRQYATAHLIQRDEMRLLRDRHLDWCLELAELSEAKLWTSEQLTWLNHLDTEHNNLRAALAWSASESAQVSAGLRLAGSLWRFWDLRGHLAEGRGWLEKIVARSDGEAAPTRARARAWQSLGYLAMLQRDAPNAATMLALSADSWRTLGDRAGLAESLLFQGMLGGWVEGPLQAASPLLEESLTLARGNGPGFVVYLALMRLSEVAGDRGDFEHATACISESMLLARAAGDTWGLAHALLCSGLLALQQSNSRGAADALLESLELRYALRDLRGMATSMEALGGLVAAQQPAPAAQLFGAAQALRRTMSVPHFGPMGALREQGVAAAREALGETAFAAELAAGATTPIEDALDCADEAARTCR
jgi:non-specific serine/threonine protein kinase